jgi:hypothetical protein
VFFLAAARLVVFLASQLGMMAISGGPVVMFLLLDLMFTY